MPRKTFYISDADMVFYEKAKEYAGESISSIFVQSLKDYVISHEKKETGMEPHTIFVGTEDIEVNEIKGEKLKFVGKVISSDVYDYEPDRIVIFTLFYTKKKKFLLHISDENTLHRMITCSYKILNSVSELYSAGLTKKLLSGAEKYMGNESTIPCKELDV